MHGTQPEERPTRVVHPTSRDDAAIVARILAHDAAKTTDLADEVLHEEPVDHYRSPDRLALERAHVLEPAPRVFCHASEVANPGDYVAAETGGVPIVVVRDREGVLRAHRNACSHRGLDVVPAGKGNAPGFSCRYHGWTYRLDGELHRIPRQAVGFPGLECTGLGLVPVEVAERFGLVWVRLARAEDATDLEADLESTLGEVALELEPIGLEPMTLFASGESTVPIQWKTLLEGFIEGYHIRTTHPESFYPLGFDTLNAIDVFGPHTRIVFPYQRLRSLAERPRDAWHLHRMATVVYHLFPATLVIVNSLHTAVLSFEPLSTTETRMRRFSLAPPAMLELEPEKVERDAAFVEVGLTEDFAMGERITRGATANPNRTLRYGRFEGNLIHFLKGIEQRIREGEAKRAHALA